MGNDGIVISDLEPNDNVGKFTWLKINPDGSKEWYERADGNWQLVKSETAPASADHTHDTLNNLNITGMFGIGGDRGVTGSKTFGGYTLTFKEGVLTGFEPAE